MADIADLDAARKAASEKQRLLNEDARERLKRHTDEINKTFAVVNDHGTAWIFQEVDNPLRPGFRNIYRLKPQDFKLLFQNKSLTVMVPAPTRRDSDAIKAVSKSLAFWWLEDPRRREYLKGALFAPGQKLPKGVYNFWNGWAVPPIQPGRGAGWPLLQDHLYRVICSSHREWYEYLVNLLARMVQFPGERGEVAIVLRGTEGIGKGIAVSYLMKMFGTFALHLTNSLHLRSQYNAHLQYCILLFIDEAYWAGDKEFEGALRGMITEDRLAVEAKYENLHEAKNCLHLIMSSNVHWVAPVGLDDRRFFVLDVQDFRREQKEYFDALEHERDFGGGAQAMLYDLLHRDISNFDWRKIPDTPARRAQKRLSLDTVTQYWMMALDRGFAYRSKYGVPSLSEWSEFYSSDLLVAGYMQWCDDGRRYQRQSAEDLYRMLERLYGERQRPRIWLPMHEVERLVPGHGSHESPGKTGQSELPYPDPEPTEADGAAAAPGPVEGLPDDPAHVVVMGYRRRGYRVGTLEEARARFDQVLGPLDTPWNRS